MKQSQAKKRDNAMTNKILMGLIALVLGLLFLEILIVHSKNEQQKNASNQVQTARIMANGDLLYHDGLYMSALQSDGRYDFTENFTYVKPWLKQADLVLGDFEGTINPDYPLSGYPLFNAPQSVTAAIKDAGYDVMDLAHNHILDSGLEGAFTTADAFKKWELILLVFTKSRCETRRHFSSRMLMVSKLQYFPMLMVTMA